MSRTPEEISKLTNWWVHTPHNGRRVVHLPSEIEDDDYDPMDIDDEPEAEPLCTVLRNRSGQDWTVTSAVVIPAGYFPLCSRCEARYDEQHDDKPNTAISK